MASLATIALGSNIEPEANLREAVRELAHRFTVVAVSPVYRTAPVGYADQPDFLNAVVQVRTDLAPEALLAALHEIEREHDRRRPFPNAPRTLDLDLLLVGDTVVNTATLRLPHPRLHERAFVLVPLADVASDAVHPTLGSTVRELAAQVGTEGVQPDPLDLAAALAG